MVRMITAAAALTIAGSAMAAPTGAYWVQVDNSTNIAGTDTGFETSWLTYDLYVGLEAGDIIGAADFGVAGGAPPNVGLSTDGTFFSGAPGTNDSVFDNSGFIATVVGDAEYTSAVTINGGPLAGFALAMDWDPAGVTGAWFVNPLQLGTGGLNGPDDMWLARVTVSVGTQFLGGEAFVSGRNADGTNFGGDDPATGVIQVPNAIPTPGALALFGLAGAAAIRRRR